MPELWEWAREVGAKWGVSWCDDGTETLIDLETGESVELVAEIGATPDA